MSQFICSFLEDPGECQGNTPEPLGLNDSTAPHSGQVSDQTPGTVGLNDSANAASTGALELATSTSATDQTTPTDFMNLYRNLTVPYVDQETGLHCSATADVHSHVNNYLSKRHSNEDEKAAIQQQVR
jgi:hypothetical protein